jgi:murein DD-endopeptidase MepM/ murein hydrolase activator NlpD
VFACQTGAVLLLALAGCQPGSPRPIPTDAVPSEDASRPGWFFGPSYAVEADLDAVQASAEGVRAVLSRLSDKERLLVLNRWLAAAPAPRPATAPLAVDTAPLPESLDLLGTLRGLYATQGSRDLALAAFFLGPEPVDRARARLKSPPEGPSLEKLATRLTARERRALRYVREARAQAILHGLTWPVERTWRLTSRFGSRLHPILGKEIDHRGVDIGVPEGTPIRAPAAGVVVGVREGKVNGQSLELLHEEGVRTLYCHLSLVEVKQGQKIQAGELVARSGETGRVTGPHLHYQVKYAGDWLDPVGLRVAPERVAAPLPWPAPSVPAPRLTQAAPL